MLVNHVLTDEIAACEASDEFSDYTIPHRDTKRGVLKPWYLTHPVKGTSYFDESICKLTGSTRRWRDSKSIRSHHGSRRCTGGTRTCSSSQVRRRDPFCLCVRESLSTGFLLGLCAIRGLLQLRSVPTAA